MNIGIIGAGNIAGTVGILWAKAGHTISFGARQPDKLGPLLAKTGPSATAGSVAKAAGFGEVVFCSVPYGAWPTLAPVLAPLVAGKVVLDSANRRGLDARSARCPRRRSGGISASAVTGLARDPARLVPIIGLSLRMADAADPASPAPRSPPTGRSRR